ncbi:MAG: 4-phosphoerythronate dehydrogenase [bacterium]
MLVESAFSTLGQVRAVEKDDINRELVAEADMLLVRSETTVNGSLLAGSRVCFVGSPTSGFDHVDLDYLEKNNIRFAHAAGCNARSVAEYVLAALLAFQERHDGGLRGKTLGVVGVGNIGSKVAQIGRALGMTVLCNDPPKAQAASDPSYLALDELMECDFLTLHVPLTRTGAHPTYHLFGPDRLAKLNPGCVLINTSRGGVVHTGALKSVLRQGKVRGAILDVWEDEPNIDVELLHLADIATPHIAGYSYDGKVRGTQMVFEAARSFLGVSAPWQPGSDDAIEPARVLDLSDQGEQELHARVQRFYDIRRDDQDLRAIVHVPEGERGAYFWHLRRAYRKRREFLPLHGVGKLFSI